MKSEADDVILLLRIPSVPTLTSSMVTPFPIGPMAKLVFFPTSTPPLFLLTVLQLALAGLLLVPWKLLARVLPQSLCKLFFFFNVWRIYLAVLGSVAAWRIFIAAHRLGCPMACEILVSPTRSNPCPLALKGRFLTTDHQGSSRAFCICSSVYLYLAHLYFSPCIYHHLECT